MLLGGCLKLVCPPFVYGHVDPESIKLKKGSVVSKGQLLGQYADPENGSATAPHLYFEHWKNGVSINPLPYAERVMPANKLTSEYGMRFHPIQKNKKFIVGW